MKLFKISALLILAAIAGHAQNRTRFSNIRNAWDYAYGINPNVPYLQVFTGNGQTGVGTLQLITGCVVAGDGQQFCPLAINAPITVDIGANAETITPTAVSAQCFVVTLTYNGCTVTATYNKVHGTSAIIFSGTVGLQEALNQTLAGVGTATGNPGMTTGGAVIVGTDWVNWGGTTAMLQAAYLGGYSAGLTINGPSGSLNGYPATVSVWDNRTLNTQYWTLKPSATTTFSAGSAVTLAQVAGGSLTSSGTYRVSYWYVDVLGGLSQAATDSSQIALTGSNQTITTTAPAATTGAVAWIPLISPSGGANGSEIMVPVTSSVCVVSTLETIIPACAIGATATISANPSSTAKEFAAAIATGHTTFASIPTSGLPELPIQSVFAPFGQVASISAAANADIAMVYFPAGYFNYLGKAVDFCFQATATLASTGIPTLTVTMANQYGQSPGTAASYLFPTQTGSTQYTGCVEFDVAATGASGTFWPGGMVNQMQGANTNTVGIITTAAQPASSAPNLTQGLWVTLNLGMTTAGATNVTVNQFVVKPINNN